ncbi:MAG: type II secretion system F family protein [Firmicutes bacterium]|nr:type II secretion system F family protein [Bacillota bacterium]
MSKLVTYKYTAISRSGERVSGIMEGFDELDVVDKIKETCLIVEKLTEVKDNSDSVLNMEIGGNKLNKKAFTVMCSQFAIILRAGLPVARTASLIAAKTTDKKLKKVLQKVAADVEGGRTLSASFQDHGEKLFPSTFIEALRAGEESGNIDKSFETMHNHFDKQMKMKGKVRNALIYPAFVMAVAVVVVAVLMIKVVPTFISIFDSYGAELPLITQLLILISNFFVGNWIKMLAFFIVAFIVFKLYTNTEKGRLKFARFALRMPVFGNINELNAASQFANTMATMLGSGIPMTKSVSITAKVIENYYISQEVGKITTKIEEGNDMGTSLKDAACLPDILVDMVAVGEETGEMEETLDTIAKYYDSELEMAITSALNKLEPAILVVMAGIAGFIVIAVYVAMFGMYAAM